MRLTRECGFSTFIKRAEFMNKKYKQRTRWENVAQHQTKDLTLNPHKPRAEREIHGLDCSFKNMK